MNTFFFMCMIEIYESFLSICALRDYIFVRTIYIYWIALVPCGELPMLSFTWRYLHSLAYSRYDDACGRRSFPGKKNCDNKTICEINEFNRWSFRISLKVTLFKWNKNSSEMTHIVWKCMEWLGLKCNMISTYFIYRDITRWWFQTFSPLPGEDSYVEELIFSNGLVQPATRWCGIHTLHLWWQVMSHGKRLVHH